MSNPWPQDVVGPSGPDDWSNFKCWEVSGINAIGDPYSGIYFADTGPNAVIAAYETIHPMFLPLTGVSYRIVPGPYIST